MTRVRKRQSGDSNLRHQRQQQRWSELTAGVNDVLPGSTPSIQQYKHKSKSKLTSSATLVHRNKGLDASEEAPDDDFDGDGVVDAREMRLAQLLDEMLAKRVVLQQRQHVQSHLKPSDRPQALQHCPGGGDIAVVSSEERQHLRQAAGRLLLAKEFVERNRGQLWRYGTVFAGQTDDESAAFIAEHAKFAKFLAFLEATERQRAMRTSRRMREGMQDPEAMGPRGYLQTQVVIADARGMKSKASSTTALLASNNEHLPHVARTASSAMLPQHSKFDSIAFPEDDDEDIANGIATNDYGAIDVDGDGVVDADEMKMNLRLQELTEQRCSGGPGGLDSAQHAKPLTKLHLQQHEGRVLMAREFVERNADRMWLYDVAYRSQSVESIIDTIASSSCFAKDFNALRTKERLLTLKSSRNVARCLQHESELEDVRIVAPTAWIASSESRPVKSRTELLVARRQLACSTPQTSQSNSHALDNTLQHAKSNLRLHAASTTQLSSASSCLPQIFHTPRRIDAIGDLSLTKWKFGDH